MRPPRRATVPAPSVGVLLCLLAATVCLLHSTDGRAVKIKYPSRKNPSAATTTHNVKNLIAANKMLINGTLDAGRAATNGKETRLDSLGIDVCGKRPLRPVPRRGGLQPARSDIRVVAGIQSTRRWPWQVALLNKTSGEPFCGGTLIGRDYVLTAAHCFDNKERNENTIHVILGEHDRSRHEGTEQVFTIDCIQVHNRYVKGVPYNNDIAIIKLKTFPENDVFINDFVLPACLPDDKSEFTAGDSCYVTGWGYTNFVDFTFGRRPNIINEARLPILTHDECRQAYGSFISRKMICAGYLEGERRADTCKGDSGGPLICKARDGLWKLVGVTSWGENTFCNPSPTDAVPGVYTRVSRYKRWINKQVNMRKCRTRLAPSSP